LQNQLGLLKSRRTEVKGEIDASYERSATLDAASSGDGEATTLGKRKSTGRQNMDASPDSAKDGLQKRVNEENALRKLNFSRKTTLDAQIEELEREITAINIEKSSLKHDFSRKCIADRNDYAVTHIQQDFAAGIYEMDKKTAANVGFASPHPVRDYNALAESLVVFCVSPRAHQRLRGRQQKGSAILGFKDIEETGIPTLQRFCMDSTLAVRAEASANFLNGLEQLINSLRFSSSRAVFFQSLSAESKRDDSEFLNGKLAELEDVSVYRRVDAASLD
jgi:hypothetical protein